MPELNQIQSGGVIYDLRDQEAARRTDLSRLEEAITTLESKVSDDTTKLANGFVVENETLYLAHDGEILDRENGVAFADHTGGLQFDSGKVDDDGYLHLTYEGADIDDFQPFFIGSGGGGSGGGSGGSASIVRITESGILATYGRSCPVQFTFTAADSAGDVTGAGSEATWYVNNVKKATQILALGNNTFDAGPYLTAGNNTLKISVSVDVGASTPLTVTKTWVINAINLSVTWEFDDTSVVETETFQIRWTPYGDVSKTTHVKIDGVEALTSSTNRSGVLQTATLTKPSHGHHLVEMYLTATVSGTEIRSDSIFHDIMCLTSGNTDPIVASSFPDGQTMNQYDTIQIPYVVHTPTSLTSTVTLKADNVVLATLSADRTLQTWNYTPSTAGNKTLTIECGNISRTILISVDAVEIDNEEVGGYTFRMKASDMAGNSALRNWTSNGITATFSENFDWDNGGIKSESDEHGNLRQYIAIKAGTRMTINHQLFADDPTSGGKSIKVVFKVTNVRSYDAQWFTCYANGIGLRMGAHSAVLTSEQSSLQSQYAEDKYIEIEFDIYPDSDQRYILPYINGVIAGVTVYAQNDSFTQPQGSRQNIIIGSDDCDINIYMLKAYPNNLTTKNHLVNFIADAPNSAEMVARYNRNDIFNDRGDEISYSKLAEHNPNLRVHLFNIPRMTQDKKDYVYNVDYQQLFVNGRPEDRIVAENCRISVQGTSSVGYILGAANTDIVFQDGVTDENGTHTDGYAMTADSVPVNYMCTKVNFASCEGVNNAVNAEWYNRFQPYICGSRAKNPKARDTMEFHMGVQFIADQSRGLFSDTEYHMYSVVNMGNSKKNTAIFHDTTNPLECCVEVRANHRELCDMITKDFTGETWGDKEGDAFEFRYPSKPTDEQKAAWQAFVTWMCDNNPEAATNESFPTPVTFAPYTFKGHDGEGNVLKGTTVYEYAGTYERDTFEYRMAKMLSECEDHMVMDAVIYHYLFLERHTLMDNVSKNNFWSSHDLIHWYPKNAYDMDTSDGNNNEGRMVFSYGLETTDSQDGKRVFNSPHAVWLVFAQALYEPARTMYINREALGAWSAANYIAECDEWQSEVPEACWNQDYWYKYLRTYEQGIEETWLEKLDGGKKEAQRYQYELFQEKYLASKYTSIVAASDRATLRVNRTQGDAQERSQISLTMYCKCYASITVGSTKIYRERVNQGQSVTLDFSDYGSFGDTEFDINLASMVQRIGDISHLYPTQVSIGAATRLREIEIGSNAAGYANTGLTMLSFGANTMLEKLYVQNLPSIHAELDLSGCQALSEVDATGSSFTGYTFARGGLLESAILNAPTSLTLLSLHYLSSDGLQISNYDNLNALRVEDCPLLDTLAMVNAANNLTRARLLDIDWVIPATTILNRMLGIMGMDESGHMLDISVLTGDVAISGSIRQSEITAYHEAWGNELILDYDSGQVVTQYLVIYKNTDGTVLCTLYVDRGSNAPDPVATGVLSAPPEREPDAQYTYTYSGWDDLSAVISERIVTATYETHTREYTVTFYSRAGLSLYATTVPYGSEVVYPYELPTNTESESAREYNVFMGWDKSTGFITHDLDVFAVWDHQALTSSDRSSSGYVPLSEMTPAQILGVRQMNAAAAYWEPKEYFEFTVGRDFNFSNVKSVTLISQPTYFDGETVLEPDPDYYDDGTPFDGSLALLSENSGNWTVAIDFEFNDDTSDQTLVSLFEEDGNEGFRLRYGAAPNIQWGNVNANVGNGMRRGIVVIRHKAGSLNVNVYCHDIVSDNYSDSMSVYELARVRSTVTNMSITFGAVKFAGGGYDYYAKGWINWCKVWFDDLGANNCRQMGNWPREVWRAEYSAANGYRLAGTSAQTCAASFVLNNLLPMGHRHHSTNTNVGGWPESEINPLLNGRVFNALPVWMQSLIRAVRIISSTGNQESSTVTCENKIYLPSKTEIDGTASDPYYSETQTRIPWLTSNASRVKWRGIINPLNPVDFYTSQQDPTMQVETYQVKEEDIWRNTDNGYYYMYVSAETRSKHHFFKGINLSSDGHIVAQDGGIWIIASSWWTRSPNASGVTYWIYVSNSGGSGNISSAAGTGGLLLGFSI